MPDPLLIAAGDAGLDVIIRPDGRLERGDDTPGRVEVLPGGQAANVAVWARTQGVRAHLLTTLGRDPLGALVQEALSRHGVTLTARVGRRTTRVASLLEADRPFDRSLVADLAQGPLPAIRPALDGLDLGDAPHALLYVSGYVLLRPGAARWLRAAAPWAHRLGIPIAASPSAVSVLTRVGSRGLEPLLRSSDILLLNRLEAESLTGCADALGSLDALAPAYRLVLLTDGPVGAWLSADGHSVRVPPWTPRPTASEESPPATAGPVDTTGAGDATAGAFLGAWLTGRTPMQAARRAMRAGYLATRHMGAWPTEGRGRDAG